MTFKPEKTTNWGGDPSRFINQISVEEDCLDLPYTQEILSRAEGLPVTVIPARSQPTPTGPYPESLKDGKRHLLLAKNLGRFFKPCPATREYRCCDYQVLNIGMNCPMDCVYCILQAYLNNPHLSFFVNINDMLAEIKTALANEPDRFFRIGTGEFTDSLAIDRLTGLSRIMVEFMADKKQAVLELKTKSAVIGHLENLEHKGRTVVAWSLNSPAIMEREEIRTASLTQRLAAAAQCADWGYKLAFHFDPIIYHPGWQEGYSKTIKQLYATVPKEAIVWISMGALRFLPQLKNIADNRFPKSRFFYEEFVTGLDNKSR
ncbi:MAG: DNA photolyase, partial [Desulfobulbaceae bacterium]|nr:DNA photolyase [Desulfobulbaceae bacterium]